MYPHFCFVSFIDIFLKQASLNRAKLKFSFKASCWITVRNYGLVGCLVLENIAIKIPNLKAQKIFCYKQLWGPKIMCIQQIFWVQKFDNSKKNSYVKCVLMVYVYSTY